MNRFFLVFLALTISLTTSCSGNKKAGSELPSWYLSPKQNSAENLYGVAEGYTLEEATKSALVDAASRLMVSISSESTLLREENKTDANEESRQQIKQNIEKIDFTNFKVSRSEKMGQKIYVEAEIKRSPFISDQKEKVGFLERKITDLDKNLAASNPIQKRASLLKMLDFSNQAILSTRILNGAGENINLKEKLARQANFENQLNSLNDKIEFFFEINSPKEISQIIRNALNKEKIAIAKTRNSSSNQIVIAIKSSSRNNKIYEAYMTKLQIDFENISNAKTISSSSVEVSGSSSIGEKESYAAAVKSFEEKVSQDGILKVIGITN